MRVLHNKSLGGLPSGALSHLLLLERFELLFWNRAVPLVDSLLDAIGHRNRLVQSLSKVECGLAESVSLKWIRSSIQENCECFR